MTSDRIGVEGFFGVGWMMKGVDVDPKEPDGSHFLAQRHKDRRSAATITSEALD